MGSGKTTDQLLVKKLHESTPQALEKAQNLLTATAKYVEKSGLLSSEASRLRNMQSKYYEFHRALMEEQPTSDRQLGGEEDLKAVYNCLSLVSDAFPNWQKEYETLNRFIKLF